MENTNEEIKRLKRMMDSCFTYGGLEETNYNFGRYIKPIIDELGDIGNTVYQEYKKHLAENFTVQPCVYTDCEGLNYNSLTPNK